jgi:hypothetical protein
MGLPKLYRLEINVPEHAKILLIFKLNEMLDIDLVFMLALQKPNRATVLGVEAKELQASYLGKYRASLQYGVCFR